MTNRNVCIAFSVEKIVKLCVGLMGEEFSDGLVLLFMGHTGKVRNLSFICLLFAEVVSEMVS